ncbi:MAG: DeoR/GlpR transcriptional regulator [Clostridia bacterium]|nr:DeoR/GlpR transcriptional regulator [Clostridia bacterium]
MLKKERQTQIMDLMNEKKYCSVEFLAKKLYVAPITIRRDLQEMEASGLIARCHGGASVPLHENREVPFEVRERKNQAVKAALAKQAASLIQTGDVVFIDSSSTAGHIVDYIFQDMNLTVVTNSMRVASRLNEKHIKCYLTGGAPVETSNALVGSIAERTVSEFFANICFFSSQGITEDGIITDYSEAETALRRLMIKNSQKSVFLYDKTKYGKRFAFKVCTDKDVNVITNK